MTLVITVLTRALHTRFMGASLQTQDAEAVVKRALA